MMFCIRLLSLLIPAFFWCAVQAAEPHGLAVTYFDNVDFTGTSVSRIDPQIDFQAIGSPSEGISPDWWSAVWVGSLNVTNADTYTFTTRSDDGIVLIIDGTVVIQNWTGHGPTNDVGSISLSPGPHSVVLRFYNSHGTATLQWFWESATLAKQIVPSELLTPIIPPGQIGSGSGLSAKYYPRASFSGIPVERKDAAINFTWGTEAPALGIGPAVFSTEWSGWIEPPYSDTYTFYADADDGFSLWIDGQPVIESLEISARHERLGVRTLIAGRRYEILVRHRQVGGEAKAILRWSCSMLPKQVIPSQQLYPSEAADGSVAVNSGLDSFTNPAWVTGSRGSGSVVIDATVNGNAIPVMAATRQSWFLAENMTRPPGVTVQPGANAVQVTAELDEHTVQIEQVLNWVTLDLSDLPYGLDRLVIRPGEQLRVTARKPGVALVITQTEGDPSSPINSVTFNGVPNQEFIATFPHSGRYTLNALVDGADAGTLNVTVPDVQIPAPIACEIGFERVKDVSVSHADDGDVWFGGNDESLIAVGQGSATAIGRQLTLRPLARGDLFLASRIQGADGPVLRWCPVDEFTIETSAQSRIDVVQTFPDGSLLTQAVLTMTPLVPDLDVRLTMYTGGATFIDGTTQMIISSNDFVPGVGSGTCIYQIIRSPQPGSYLCHTTQVYQNSVLVGSH